MDFSRCRMIGCHCTRYKESFGINSPNGCIPCGKCECGHHKMEHNIHGGGLFWSKKPYMY